MDTNYWFYTLSTIAQSLAAIIALFATFIVVVLGNLNKEINDYAERMINILVKCGMKSHMDYYGMSKDAVFSEFISFFKIEENYKNSGLEDAISGYCSGLPTKDEKKIEYIKNFIKNTINIFNKIKTKKLLIYKYLRMSLVLTSISIISSFTGLTIIPPYLYFVIFLTFISSLTVIYITVSIWKIIKD